MARKDIFAGIADQPRRERDRGYQPTGAAKAMIGSLEEFAELAQKGGILELDPSLIDPSPFPDRLPDDDPHPYEEFRKSMAEEGQKVPIQVRPHPAATGRYQVIYGHRRLRAARDLGIAVKAVPISLSDTELVIAQGIENASRQDLSWIERALFAKRMEDAGVRSRDIQAALSIDRAELAKLRGVGTTVPVELIEAIGRAPRIGRPRWQELAKQIERHPERLGPAQRMLSSDNKLISDQRFQLVLDTLKPAVMPKAINNVGVKISATTTRGRAFAKFIERRLPALMEEFEKQEN